jgi:branched-chain amino acid transport system permease protein
MTEPSAGPAEPAASPGSRQGILGWVVVSLVLLVFLLIPLFVSDVYYLHVFILIFYFAYLGTAWSLVGMAGQMSIGHAAFVGIGGYVSTLLFMDLGISPWLGMWVGAVAAALVGVALGYPTFRLRGPYFALTTIAFAEILRIYVENTEVGPFGVKLRAAMGLLLPFRGDAPASFQFFSKEPYYYIALIMMCAAVFISYTINRTRLGYYLAAIRGDRDAAESLGINLTKYNLVAMALSCFLTAIGGTFYAQYFRYINPERGMGLSLSIEIVLVGVVGGWQSVLGPTIGSLLLSPTSEIIRGEFGGSYAGLHLVLYGLLLMIVILFLPKGINEPLTRALHTLEAKLWPAQAETAGTPSRGPTGALDVPGSTPGRGR